MNKCKASAIKNLDLKKAISERKNVSNTWHKGGILNSIFTLTSLLLGAYLVSYAYGEKSDKEISWSLWLEMLLLSTLKPLSYFSSSWDSLRYMATLRVSVFKIFLDITKPPSYHILLGKIW